jgi:hypothetical protein
MGRNSYPAGKRVVNRSKHIIQPAENNDKYVSVPERRYLEAREAIMITITLPAQLLTGQTRISIPISVDVIVVVVGPNVSVVDVGGSPSAKHDTSLLAFTTRISELPPFPRPFTTPPFGRYS